MEKFRKYIAALLLALFVSSTVLPYKAQAQLDILGTVQQGAELAAILATMTEQLDFLKQGSKKVSNMVRFAQTSYYSVQSLRILETYVRQGSQYCSDIINGRFYNVRDAMYRARAVLLDIKGLQKEFTVVKDWLDIGGGEGNSSNSDGYSVIKSIYERISSSYDSFCSTKYAILLEEGRNAQKLYQMACLYYLQTGDTSELTAWQKAFPEQAKKLKEAMAASARFDTSNMSFVQLAVQLQKTGVDYSFQIGD